MSACTVYALMLPPPGTALYYLQFDFKMFNFSFKIEEIRNKYHMNLLLRIDQNLGSENNKKKCLKTYET